jgi:hypothetical protein
MGIRDEAEGGHVLVFGCDNLTPGPSPAWRGVTVGGTLWTKKRFALGESRTGCILSLQKVGGCRDSMYAAVLFAQMKHIVYLEK